MSLEAFKKQNKIKQETIIAAGVKEFSEKTYSDASTDKIVQSCGISKGLLFHYFGSKKGFYLHCLTDSLDKLMQRSVLSSGDFYSILFSFMDEKLSLCARYPVEMRFVNMASRDMTAEINLDKMHVLMKYTTQTRASSAALIKHALATVPLKSSDINKVLEGVSLYCNAIISKYLLAYQNNPDDFFEDAEKIKIEIKEFMDLMLHGIIKEESV